MADFRVWINVPNTGANGNIIAHNAYDTDIQRINGFQAGQPASSKRVNTALRSATLVAAALMNVVAPDSTDNAESNLSDIQTRIYNYFQTEFITGTALDTIREDLSKETIDRFLQSGFEGGTKVISEDLTTITLTASDGKVLTKTFTDNFLTITSVLKQSAEGAEIARAVKTISDNGLTISTVITYS